MKRQTPEQALATYRRAQEALKVAREELSATSVKWDGSFAVLEAKRKFEKALAVVADAKLDLILAIALEE